MIGAFLRKRRAKHDLIESTLENQTPFDIQVIKSLEQKRLLRIKEIKGTSVTVLMTRECRDYVQKKAREEGWE